MEVAVSGLTVAGGLEGEHGCGESEYENREGDNIEGDNRDDENLLEDEELEPVELKPLVAMEVAEVGLVAAGGVYGELAALMQFFISCG